PRVYQPPNFRLFPLSLKEVVAHTRTPSIYNNNRRSALLHLVISTFRDRFNLTINSRIRAQFATRAKQEIEPFPTISGIFPQFFQSTHNFPGNLRAPFLLSKIP